MVRRDKEQLIRKLLKEGSDWEHIRKVAHCSPNTIQKVQEKSKQIRAPKIKSKESEALQLYRQRLYSPSMSQLSLTYPPMKQKITR